MKVSDDVAANCLALMIEHHWVPIGEAKAGWTRFIMSLWHRTPEAVARSRAMIRKHYEEDDLEEYRAAYAKLRRPDDPETIEEYLKSSSEQVDRTAIQTWLRIMQSERVGAAVMGMEWAVVQMKRLRFPLLTSDRPVVMSNGLAKPESHIVMPLSPDHIFVASNSAQTTSKLRAMARNGSLASTLNDRMARQARKYVYGSDDQQLGFVENRLGQRIACSTFE
jgi:hypothetical protein